MTNPSPDTSMERQAKEAEPTMSRNLDRLHQSLLPPAAEEPAQPHPANDDDIIDWIEAQAGAA